MGIKRLQPAQLAAAGQIDREHEVRQAAPLRAGLEHAAGAAERLRQREALGNVLGAGLLAIDVLAGLGGQDRGGGVPVRAGGDEDRVNVAAGQQFAQIAIHRAILVAVFVIRLLLDGFAPRGLDVADGDELHVRFLEEATQHVGAAAADADAAQHDAFAGSDPAVPAEHGAAHDLRGDQQGAHLRGGLEKPPTVEAGLWITRGGVRGGWAFGRRGSDSFHCYSFSVPGTNSSLWPIVAERMDACP